tara:strand:+ start:133 stop:1029 length:897 start_codon:yes stop_codon:yes gene_type:complete
MKSVITGGAGFIGSHLAEALVKLGHKVVIIDNLSTGNLKNLKSVKNKVKLVRLDLSKKNNLKKYLKNVDYIFHLAGLSKAPRSIEIPYKYYQNNLLSTLNILNSIKNTKLKKFIFTASSSCYGNPKQLPTSEKAKIQTLSPYALSKWMSEQMIIQYAKVYSFSAVSLRLFNVYGPRVKVSDAYSSVISIFLKQKFKNKPLTIVGDGKQSRSFVHVFDVVNAMIKSAKSNVSNEIFNVGSQNSIQINKIAQIFKTKKKYIPKRMGDPRDSHADIRKIKKLLNWKPKISINEGINKLLKK